MIKTIFCILSLFLIIGCKVIPEDPYEEVQCTTQSQVATNHLERLRLDSVIQKAVDSGLVGGTVLISSKSKGTYYKSFGVADIRHNQPTTKCQLYRVASLTKVIVASAVLLLIEDGLLALDTRVGNYLNKHDVEDIQQIDQITIEQLLNHTSGIPNYDDDPRFAAMILNEPGRLISLKDKLDLIKGKNLVPQWVISKFGQIYSNSNYLLLQLIIEKAAAMSFEEFITMRILVPFGLRNTSFSTVYPYPDGLAIGYVDFYGNGDMRNVNEWDANRFQADGAMISSIQDLATFHEALYSGKLLNQNSLENMQHKRLGLLQKEFDLENALGHDGIAIGYSAEMWYLSRSQLLIILLANQGRLVSENKSVLVFDNLLRQLVHLAK